ncbi:MAG TPA: glycosyltransferase family 4 protein [Draconibacterium sp.]|nr:glycosyltransferase family 4 protein [Draconibacterium sp.]
MKRKILFIYTNYSTFVKTDFEILASAHEVTKYQFKPVRGLVNTAVQLIKQKIYLLVNIWKFDTVFVWFADYHSFLPVLFAKIFGKKSIVVIGGYDVARMPEFKYGSFNSKLRGLCAIFSMKNSTLNIAVSKYVERKVKWIAKKAKTRLIYNCVNIAENKDIQPEKENLIITVGLIDSERTFLLKGIDTFIEVARLLPEYKFMIIGLSRNLPENILKSLPENLESFDRVNHEELEKFYKKAKIYCQFSRTESFGVAVVEAMNFGCIPIVTNVGGMPELVGEKGRIVKRIPFSISSQISDIVLKYYNEYNKDINDDLFDMNIRRKKILQIF